MMKRSILLLLILAFLCTGVFAGCTDEDYDSFPPLPTVSMDVAEDAEG